jgi:cytochrome c oxidase subunit 2
MPNRRVQAAYVRCGWPVRFSGARSNRPKAPWFQVAYGVIAIFKGEFMQRKYMGLVLLAAILLTTALSSPMARAETAPQRIEIIAKRFAFEPGEITLKKGQPVVLVLRSRDVAHGISIRELNVLVKVSKGGTAELKFTPDKVGDFVGHCAVFCGSGHGSMAFKVHVVD